MSLTFLSYDAFGLYEAGGPVDRIIDRFEQERVLYRNQHEHQGKFNLAYLNTPRSRRIVKEEGDRWHAAKCWAYRQLLLEGLERVFPEEAFESLPDEVLNSYTLFQHFDLECKACIRCGHACPTILLASGLCPSCKE